MSARAGSEQQVNTLTPIPRRRKLINALSSFVGVRELLLAAAGIGLVIGVCWADDRFECERIEQHADQLAKRDATLDTFVAARCDEIGCETFEIVSRTGCQAKLRVQAPRLDDYGEDMGTFITLEGLSYSPLMARWRIREVLDDTQILGLPLP